MTPPVSFDERDHGGGLDAAVALYGGAREDWIDLSTGINPRPYPLPQIPQSAWIALPDTGAKRALERAARDFWMVPEGAAVLAAPGASALIASIPRLAAPGRVRVIERTNVREVNPETIGGQVDVVVADLSFISLSTVLPALLGCADPRADIVPMVKPQFEVGKGQVGAGGVVSDPQLRAAAVLSVANRAAELGWGTAGVTASPLPGPSGNVEYFLWLRSGADGGPAGQSLVGEALADAVRRAVAEGPQ